MSTTYPSSLSDAEWDCLQRLLPPTSPHGKPRRHVLHTIFDARSLLLLALAKALQKIIIPQAAAILSAAQPHLPSP
jgi:transposase